MKREFMPDKPFINDMNNTELLIMLDNIKKKDLEVNIKKSKKSSKNRLAELWVLYQAKGGK